MAGNNDSPSDPLLIESEARYRAVIENASDMIQSVRPDGTFEFVNRTWREKLGYAEDELDRLIIWDIIHEESVAHCQELFAVAIKGLPVEHVRATFVAKDGRPIPVEGNATSRFVDGQMVATHSFFRDISERLRAEALEAENARLERERQARYLEKMAALGKLSAGLSHELNNPAAAVRRAGSQLGEIIADRDAATGASIASGLTVEQWRALASLLEETAPEAAAIRGLGPIEVSEREEAIETWLDRRGVEAAYDLTPDLARAGIAETVLERLSVRLPDGALPAAVRWLAASAALREQLEVVARGSERIMALVGSVKAYTFMDRAVDQEVDLHEGIEHTLTMLGHRLKDREIRRDYDRTLPRARARGSGLNQVWTNILDNAVDATGAAGAIAISTRREGDRAVVEISDDGCGISADHLSRVFEPFFTTKPQGLGTGLGLDIAWRIVTEEHGGAIEVNSAPGRTTFRVSLPIVVGAAEPHAGLETPRSEAEAG